MKEGRIYGSLRIPAKRPKRLHKFLNQLASELPGKVIYIWKEQPTNGIHFAVMENNRPVDWAAVQDVVDRVAAECKSAFVGGLVR
jgi:hypothetical protein